MRITINGQAHELMGVRTLSYDQIAQLAGEFEPSVTYRFRSTDAKGILMKGDRIVVTEDLIINAIRTGSA